MNVDEKKEPSRTETTFGGYRWQLAIHDDGSNLVDVYRTRFRGELSRLERVAVCFWNGQGLAIRQLTGRGDRLESRDLRNLSLVVQTVRVS